MAERQKGASPHGWWRIHAPWSHLSPVELTLIKLVACDFHSIYVRHRLKWPIEAEKIFEKRKLKKKLKKCVPHRRRVHRMEIEIHGSSE